MHVGAILGSQTSKESWARNVFKHELAPGHLSWYVHIVFLVICLRFPSSFVGMLAVVLWHAAHFVGSIPPTGAWQIANALCIVYCIFLLDRASTRRRPLVQHSPSHFIQEVLFVIMSFALWLNACFVQNIVCSRSTYVVSYPGSRLPHMGCHDTCPVCCAYVVVLSVRLSSFCCSLTHLCNGPCIPVVHVLRLSICIYVVPDACVKTSASRRRSSTL